MPRKSMTEEEHSPRIQFRVDKDVQNILADLKAQKGNKSKFIRESIKRNSIAEKFTLFFINPKVASNIPDEPRKEFLESLSPLERETIDSILEVASNE